VKEGFPGRRAHARQVQFVDVPFHQTLQDQPHAGLIGRQFDLSDTRHALVRLGAAIAGMVNVNETFDRIRFRLGVAERTLVISTSDNGPWLSKRTNADTAFPLRDGKGSTWEGGVREPTPAWWPGKVPAGSVCDAIAANFDFLPTFVELAGGTIPADRKIDGKDISPLLFGRTTKLAACGALLFQR
jgi:arylsulfatase A-like enzyme